MRLRTGGMRVLQPDTAEAPVRFSAKSSAFRPRRPAPGATSMRAAPLPASTTRTNTMVSETLTGDLAEQHRLACAVERRI